PRRAEHARSEGKFLRTTYCSYAGTARGVEPPTLTSGQGLGNDENARDWPTTSKYGCDSRGAAGSSVARHITSPVVMPTEISSGDDLHDRLQASLGDTYRIERELAPAGMSRLFLATQASLERKVVIKLLPPETASEVSAARFQREVLLAAHLQHPHILPVLTTGSTLDGIFYYIMPYVAGESLRQRLERERIPIPDAVRILREIADALAMAHERGIV